MGYVVYNYEAIRDNNKVTILIIPIFLENRVSKDDFNMLHSLDLAEWGFVSPLFRAGSTFYFLANLSGSLPPDTSVIKVEEGQGPLFDLLLHAFEHSLHVAGVASISAWGIWFLAGDIY